MNHKFNNSPLLPGEEFREERCLNPGCSLIRKRYRGSSIVYHDPSKSDYSPDLPFRCSGKDAHNYEKPVFGPDDIAIVQHCKSCNLPRRIYKRGSVKMYLHPQSLKALESDPGCNAPLGRMVLKRQVIPKIKTQAEIDREIARSNQRELDRNNKAERNKQRLLEVEQLVQNGKRLKHELFEMDDNDPLRLVKYLLLNPGMTIQLENQGSGNILVWISKKHPDGIKTTNYKKIKMVGILKSDAMATDVELWHVIKEVEIESNKNNQHGTSTF